jgi:uncharacterized protein YggE
VELKQLGTSVFAHAAIGTLLLSAALVGCAPDTLALHPASTPVAGTTAGGASSVGAPVAGSGSVIQGRTVSIQPSSGAAASAPAVVIGRTESVAPVASPVAGLSHGITVTGTGRIEARPDEAIVEAGVETRAPTAQEAQANNNTAMQAVIAAIKAQGIAAKDIQTSGVSLFPIISQNNTVTGYNASNRVTVTVENVDQAGVVLDAAIKAGANTASGVRFTFKDETALRNKALAAAAADARSKADALAAALGLQISGVQAVTEGQVNIPVPFVAPRAAAAPQAAPAVPIEPGQQTITADVTIVFGY